MSILVNACIMPFTILSVVNNFYDTYFFQAFLRQKEQEIKRLELSLQNERHLVGDLEFEIRKNAELLESRGFIYFLCVVFVINSLNKCWSLSLITSSVALTFIYNAVRVLQEIVQACRLMKMKSINYEHTEPIKKKLDDLVFNICRNLTNKYVMSC